MTELSSKALWENEDIYHIMFNMTDIGIVIAEVRFDVQG